jgi:glycosyl hydrolase family 26
MRYETHRRSLRRSASVLASLTTVFALTMAIVPVGSASAATHSPPRVLIPHTAYFGSRIEPRAGETQSDAVERVESQIGRTFAIDHFYYQWSSSFPNSAQTSTVADGRIPFINWKAGGSWAAIANGSQDATIISHADAIKSFGYPMYLGFHHEPENDLEAFGSPIEYAAAFRHIVDVFRTRGVTNVAFVWTMMGWTFNPRSGRHAGSYYPGDAYVDIVGSDGYNWYPMRSGSAWTSFRAIFTDTNSFAVAHAKSWMVVEFGTQEDPAVAGRKAQWLLDALSTAKSWPSLKALIYFDVLKDGYPWVTDSSASAMKGYRQMARDPYVNPAFRLSSIR